MMTEADRWDAWRQAKAVYDSVFKGRSVVSFWRWLCEKLGIVRFAARRIFETHDGEFVLRTFAKKNFVFDTNELSEFEQGRRAAATELIQYVWRDQATVMRKIKEMQDANDNAEV